MSTANNINIHPVDLQNTSQPEVVNILQTFLFEAIFVPDGVEAPPVSIVQNADLRVYYDGFGTGTADILVVAEDTNDNRIVGAAWSRIMNDYGHIDDETPSIAIALYKECRGQGVGTALLEGLLAQIRARGYKRVSLAVQKANFAVKLYRKLLFEVVDENGEEFIMLRRFDE